MSKVKYTPTEDMAIYRHIANRPEGVAISKRIKSCLKLKSVHPSRTEDSIRNRWSKLNGDNPPANISRYRFWNGTLTTPEQSPITALGDTFKNVQEYRGVDIYVINAYASVEVEFEEAPKPEPRKCNTLDEAIEELRKQGAKKAVIPLRDNKKITILFTDK